MTKLRIRWSTAGKSAGVIAVTLLTLYMGPSLLKPPAPPPVPADVGLPRAATRPLELPERPALRQLGRVAEGGGLRRPEAAEGKVPTRKARRPSARSSAQGKKGAPLRQDPPAVPPVPRAPAPAPPPVAPPPPAAVAAPAPASSPPPAGDGSQEFAPH